MKFEEKTSEELEELRKKLSKDLTEIRDEYSKIERKLLNKHTKLKTVNNILETRKIEDDEKTGVTDWKDLLECYDSSGIESKVKYKKFEKEVRKLGLYSGGYFPETNQRCVKVMLIKGVNESFEKTVSALKLLLPYYKPLKSKDNMIYIDIFEETLSEDGTYFLLISPNLDHFDLMLTRYHRTRKLKPFETIEDCIRYVQENHYYSDDKKDFVNYVGNIISKK